MSVKRIKEEGGTTIGYFLAELGLYLYLIGRSATNKKNTIFLFVLCLLIVLIKASGLRIGNTTTAIIIIYFLITRNKYSYKRHFVFIFFIAIIGIGFYFFRILMHTNISSIIDLKNNLVALIGGIGYYAFDKGNAPNIAILMKIIDSWGEDIGYKLGASLFYPLFSILPGEYQPGVKLMPSILIKQRWFSHIEGGFLPPTGIGEMYANFSFFGPVIGMFGFGILGAMLYNFLQKRATYLRLFIYLYFSLNFYMIYPKGEFSNLSFLTIGCILIMCSLATFFSQTMKRKPEIFCMRNSI
jgi:oligosaccharide repeat unit polymerase